MFPSPRDRRSALLVGVAIAALSASCAAPAPEECTAYLACFYPGGDKVSPYEDELSRPELAEEEQEDRARALYGPDGECWRNGTDDPVYEICQQACVAALVEACEAGRPAACVAGEEPERTFSPPDDPSLMLQCAELADR